MALTLEYLHTPQVGGSTLMNDGWIRLPAYPVDRTNLLTYRLIYPSYMEVDAAPWGVTVSKDREDFEKACDGHTDR